MILATIIEIIIVVAVIIAFWRIFERGGKQGWYALISPIGTFLVALIGGRSFSIVYLLLLFFFALFNMFVLAKIANKLNNFFCLAGGLAFAILLIYLNKWMILLILLYIFIFIQIMLISYSLAQCFGWGKSASVLFSLTPGINYLVLGFSNDQYVGDAVKTGFSGKGVNSNNIDPNRVIYIQDESEPTIQPIDPGTNSMNGTGVNLNNVNIGSVDESVVSGNTVEVNNISGNTVTGNNVNLNDINLDEMTPIGAMERPTHDDNS